MHRNDFDEDDFDDSESPGEQEEPWTEGDDGDEPDLVPCPACGKMVLAIADRCHRCGEYFGKEAWLAQRSWKQPVWAVAAALVIAAMLWFVLGVLG